MSDGAQSYDILATLGEAPSNDEVKACVAATAAHHRSIADGRIDAADARVQYPLTVRRRQKTEVFASAEDYIAATLSYRTGVIKSGMNARVQIEEVLCCGPSVILVRAKSCRLNEAGEHVSSLGFSHVHVRSGDGWKIISNVVDDAEASVTDLQEG